ncbi:hypothetical protein HCCG_01284 [Helicobacter cinaedi CCUG 18818 = ATCC BAA-847]|uniref:Lipoprotein n=1 Tax=Helicobacter cinaedi CCUG 18818 = ATCC BAA-847 TaxID=537971 RepID=A0ABN0BAZ0_9HELI|nr:hypothetical protein HCCG_01284 [Helicobacter cinaedi CCUG 18818 = ATCC BAA-847]
MLKLSMLNSTPFYSKAFKALVACLSNFFAFSACLI